MARQPLTSDRPQKEKKTRRDPTASGERDASVNRAASHNYFLLEKFEAGVALRGTEVKSVRAGRANLKDAYGLVKDAELWLINAHIGPYEHGNIFNHEPLRTRKLLVHKNELHKLIGKTQHKGLTLIPTRLYFRNGRVKGASVIPYSTPSTRRKYRIWPMVPRPSGSTRRPWRRCSTASAPRSS